MVPDHACGHLRGYAFSHQDTGGARMHGKGQTVAQAIGEEQLGRGEHHVSVPQPEHLARIELGRVPQTGVAVQRALWPSRRARGIEPESNVVAQAGVRRLRGRRPGHQGGEIQIRTVRAAGHHLAIPPAQGDRRLDRLQQRGGDQRQPCVAVGQDVGVVVSRKQRVQRYRDQASADRAQEGADEIDTVLQHQDNPISRGQAQAP